MLEANRGGVMMQLAAAHRWHHPDGKQRDAAPPHHTSRGRRERQANLSELRVTDEVKTSEPEEP